MCQDPTISNEQIDDLNDTLLTYPLIQRILETQQMTKRDTTQIQKTIMLTPTHPILSDEDLVKHLAYLHPPINQRDEHTLHAHPHSKSGHGPLAIKPNSLPSYLQDVDKELSTLLTRSPILRSHEVQGIANLANDSKELHIYVSSIIREKMNDNQFVHPTLANIHKNSGELALKGYAQIVIIAESILKQQDQGSTSNYSPLDAIAEAIRASYDHQSIPSPSPSPTPLVSGDNE